MLISDWNTLRGFFTMTLDSGMVIHKCSLHEKNGNKWVGLPTEKYQKRDGSTGYAKLIEFTDKQIADNFNVQVLRAIEKARAGQQKV